MRQIELLRLAIDVLNRLEIRYAIVGSFASGAWGEPRMTRDIDIVIELTASKVNPLCAAFPEDSFYVSRAAIEEAVAHGSQFNVIHPASGNKIDFMIAGGGWPASQLARRREFLFEDNTTAFIAAPEDVILGKLVYYRAGESEKHLRDITGILMVSGGQLDHEYIAQQTGPLGVSEIWDAILERVDKRDDLD